MHNDPYSEHPHLEQELLKLEVEVRRIHEYILPQTPYEGDAYIIEGINQDNIPVRIKIENNTKLAKYNACLIDFIELHQAKSKKLFINSVKTYHHNIYKILSVKQSASDKPIDVSSDNILLTANDMYADRDEIKEYKAKNLALPNTKKTRKSNKKEEKQEKLIAILVNLLAKESVKAKSNRYTKGKGNINAKAISQEIIALAEEHDISDSLTNDTGLATEINASLTQYPTLKNI